MDIEGLWIKVGAKFDEVEKALQKLPYDAQKAATEMEQAFKAVGVKNLEKEFRDAQAAFELLERSGTLTAKQLADAADNVKAKWAAWKEEIDDGGGALGRFATQATQLGAALTAAITAPLVGLGTAAFQAAETLDGAFDKIRVGTGATGAQLDALQGSFRNVFGDVPDDADKVAEALTKVSQRTGQIGPGLESLTRQFLDLSRVTGEQIGPSIEKVTRLFGDWSVESSKQAGTMDMLFKVSQATGLSVTALADKLVYAGAPFRQLGLSVEQSAIMLGKFEKEGVNVELVIGAMRTALAKFGKAGEEPVEAFKQLVSAIKNADVAQGNLIAAQVVGTKRMADFAAAVREGRLDLDGLFKTVMGSKETIAQAASDVQDYGEAWSKLKNQITLALEPLGAILFNTLTKIVQHLQPAIEWVSALAKTFAELPPSVQTASVALAGIVAAAGPVMLMVGQLTSAFANLQTAGFVNFSGALNGLKASLLAIAPIAIGAVAAFEGFNILSRIGTELELLAKSFSDLARSFFDLDGISKTLANSFHETADGLKQYFRGYSEIGETIATAFDNAGKAIGLWGNEIDKATAKTKDSYDFFDRLRKALDELGRADTWIEMFRRSMGPLGSLMSTLNQLREVMTMVTGKSVEMDQAAEKQVKRLQEAANAHSRVTKEQLEALVATKNTAQAVQNVGAAMQAAAAQARTASEETKQASGHTRQLGIDFANLGKHAEDGTKKAAAAAKALAHDIESTWARIDQMLHGLPKSFSEFEAALSRGLNANTALKHMEEQIYKLEQGFGSKIPEAIRKGMIVHLDLAAKQLRDFKQQADQIKLDQAFEKANAAVLAFTTNVAHAGKQGLEYLSSIGITAANIANQASAAMRQMDADFKTLGITTSQSLTRTADEATAAYDRLVEKAKEGLVSSIDLQKGLVKALDAQLAAAKASGAPWQELEAKLKSAKEALGQMTGESVKSANVMGDAWKSFGNQVSTIFTDFGKGVADAILHSKSLGQAFTKMANELKEAFMRTIVEGALKQVMKGLDDVGLSFDKLAKKALENLSAIGRSIAGIFGSGGTSVASGAAGAAGSAGSAGGAAGGAGGAAGGVMGTIGAIGSIGSLISGVIGNFQMAGMNKTLDLIEKEVRYSQIHLKNMLEFANKWWPWMENLKYLQIMESLERVLYESNEHLSALASGVYFNALADSLEGFGDDIHDFGQRVPVEIGGAIEQVGQRMVATMNNTVAQQSAANNRGLTTLANSIGAAMSPMLNELQLMRKTTQEQLRIVAEGVWATYSAVSKPGWQTTVPSLPGGPPNTGPSIPGRLPATVPNTNITVNVTSNSQNPYTTGLQVAQGINAILPARI